MTDRKHRSAQPTGSRRKRRKYDMRRWEYAPSLLWFLSLLISLLWVGRILSLTTWRTRSVSRDYQRGIDCGWTGAGGEKKGQYEIFRCKAISYLIESIFIMKWLRLEFHFLDPLKRADIFECVHVMTCTASSLSSARRFLDLFTSFSHSFISDQDETGNLQTAWSSDVAGFDLRE